MTAHRSARRASSPHPIFPRRAFPEPAPLPWVARLPYYPWLVVGTVCIGAFMGQLDASIAQLVLPTLESAFHESLSHVEWVAIAYLLTLAALLAPVGRLADMLGRKLLYTAGFVVFVVGSALCGASPSLGFLLGARVLQAVGAAFLQANSVAIVTTAAGPGRRGRAIGIQGASQALGLSVGPALGGVLISALGWQWVFYINVPAGIVGALIGWLVLPRTAGLRREDHTFDVAGAFLLAGALVCVMLVLSEGEGWGWLSGPVIGLAVLAIALTVTFIYQERLTASPVVDLSLFRSRGFTLGNVTGLLSYAVTFGAFLLVPYDLERGDHASPLQAGLLLTAVPVALGIVAPLSGAWSDRVGPRPPTVAGMLVAGIALLGLAVAPFPSSLAAIVALLAVLGLGLGLFTPANNSAIMGSAPLSRLGVAGGVLNMMRSMGTSAGVALAGTVLAVALHALDSKDVTTLTASGPAVSAATSVAYVVLAVMAFAAALLSLPRGPVRGGAKDERPPAE